MIASFGFGCGFVVSNWDLDSTLPPLLILLVFCIQYGTVGSICRKLTAFLARQPTSQPASHCCRSHKIKFREAYKIYSARYPRKSDSAHLTASCVIDRAAGAYDLCQLLLQQLLLQLQLLLLLLWL